MAIHFSDLKDGDKFIRDRSGTVWTKVPNAVAEIHGHLEYATFTDNEIVSQVRSDHE